MKKRLLRAATLVLIGVSPLSLEVAAHEYDQNDPANPDANVPGIRYRPVITDYQPTAIMTKPANWRELNDRAEKIGGPRGQLRDVNEPIRKKKKLK